MRARLIPFVALALLAPLLMVIALHRSGAPLLQPIIALSLSGLSGKAELRSTYRARRCIPFLSCRADWSGGPSRPIEMERRKKVELSGGAATEVAVPRTLLSLASFELVGISLRVGAMSSGGRVDLSFTESTESSAGTPGCWVAAAPADAELRVPRSCERVELRLNAR